VVVLTLRPAKFDCHVPTLDISGFAQTLAERGDEVGVRGGRCAAEESDYRRRRLLRARRERPRGRRSAECSQQFPPSDGDCHAPQIFATLGNSFHPVTLQSGFPAPLSRSYNRWGREWLATSLMSPSTGVPAQTSADSREANE